MYTQTTPRHDICSKSPRLAPLAVLAVRATWYSTHGESESIHVRAYLYCMPLFFELELSSVDALFMSADQTFAI